MKRWQYLRARSDLNPVRRPAGRGYIGQTPVWIDTLEGPDFYAKMLRKGVLISLGEADERPRPVAAEPVIEEKKAEPPPKKSKPKAKKAEDSEEPV